MSRVCARFVALYAAAGTWVVLGTACAHHRPAPIQAPTPVATASPPAPPTPPAATPVSDEGAAHGDADAARQVLSQMTFFAFDKSLLSDQDRSTLDAKVPILLNNPGLHIWIDGNCDDRGSDEYNMALGQRRAAAAKRYLTDHGVDPSRIDVVSYGRERPIAPGETESAWARDRNDQFEIVAGGDQRRAGQ